jgi:hypothetical protein
MNEPWTDPPIILTATEEQTKRAREILAGRRAAQNA